MKDELTVVTDLSAAAIRRRNWLAIAIGTIVMMFSYFPYAAAFARSEGAPPRVDGALVAVGVAVAPFVFAALGFVSRNPLVVRRVLQSMGLLLVVGLGVGLISPALGASVGFAVGGVLTLNPPDLPDVQRYRRISVGVTLVYVLFLLLIVPPGGVFAGALVPLIMVGFADEYAAWRSREVAEPTA